MATDSSASTSPTQTHQLSESPASSGSQIRLTAESALASLPGPIEDGAPSANKSAKRGLTLREASRRCFSGISPSFAASVEWALRTAVAATIALIIVMSPQTSAAFTAPVLAPVAAIIATAPSLGQTMQCAWTVITGSFWGALSAFIVLSLFGGDYPVIIGVSLFIFTFLISFTDQVNQWKKLAMLLYVIAVLRAVADPLIDPTSALQNLTSVLLGSACAIALLLFPFPRRAVSEFRRGAMFTTVGVHKLFSTLVKIYSMADPSASEGGKLEEAIAKHQVKANLLMRAISGYISEMRGQLSNGIQWELLFHSAGPLQRYLALLDGAMEGLQGMFDAVSDLDHNDFHRHMIDHLREPLQSLSAAVSDALQTAARGRRRVGPLAMPRTNVRTALEGLLNAFRSARYEVFYHSPVPVVIDTHDTLPMHFFIWNIRNTARCVVSMVDELFGEAESRLYSLPLANPVPAVLAQLADYWLGRPVRVFRAIVHRLRRPGLARFKLSPNEARKCKGALQIALAVTIASLVVLVPPIRERFSFGYWAPVTVALVMERSSSQGGSFRRSTLRLQGTVAGSIAGYLMVVLLGRVNIYAMIALLGVWMALCAYVRTSPSIGYAGGVAAFAANVVVLAALAGGDITLLALYRIEQNLLGIMVILAINLSWPVRATRLLRYEVVRDALNAMQKCLCALMTDLLREPLGAAVAAADSAANQSETDRDVEAPRPQNGPDLTARLEREIAGNVKYQKSLIDEATNEPRLWRLVPFPADVYRRITDAETKMTRWIVVMDRSLRSAVTEGQQQYTLLIVPLHDPLKALAEDVIQTMDELVRLMSVRSPRVTVSRSVLQYHVCHVSDSYNACENRLKQVIASVVDAHRGTGGMPRLSNEDVFTFHSLLFATKHMVAELGELWRAVMDLIHTEHLCRGDILGAM